MIDDGLRAARVASLAAAATLLAAGCGRQQEDGGWRDRDQATPAVEVVQARLDALPLRERLTGTVQAGGQVAIHPQTSGAITQVYVDDGTVVRAGDPLVRIESRSPRSQLAQAQADLAAARAEARAAAASLTELEKQFERTRLLAEDSLVAQETLELERARIEAARAAVQQAEARAASAEAAIAARSEEVGRTVVRAPIDGVVGQRAAEVGMIADGQTPLFTIGQLERMRVEVPIAQDLIGRIRPGQRVDITTEAYASDPIRAEISRVSPFLAQGSFSAEAEIDVENPGGRLVPGMFVTVDVFYGESDSTTVVPASAVYSDPTTGRPGVFIASPPDTGGLMRVAANGTGALTDPRPTRFVPVRIVAEGRQTVGVAGVRPDQWVVVIGQNLLTEETEETPLARLRPASWERIIALQERLGTDLLTEVMEEHERESIRLEGGAPSGGTSAGTGGS